MASLTFLAACFASFGVVATSVTCTGAAGGFTTGQQTCTSSGPNFGQMCMKTEINGVLKQGCDGSPNVPSICSLAGNPITCCRIPATGQKIICKPSDFATLVNAADLQNCSAQCDTKPGCVDDTAMFNQRMSEPKCLFLLGHLSYGCDWTLHRIQMHGSSFNYTGKDMNTQLGDLCRWSCGRCQSETTTRTETTMSSAAPPTVTTTGNPAPTTETTTGSPATSTKTSTSIPATSSGEERAPSPGPSTPSDVDVGAIIAGVVGGLVFLIIVAASVRYVALMQRKGECVHRSTFVAQGRPPNLSDTPTFVAAQPGAPKNDAETSQVP